MEIEEFSYVLCLKEDGFVYHISRMTAPAVVSIRVTDVMDDAMDDVGSNGIVMKMHIWEGVHLIK